MKATFKKFVSVCLSLTMACGAFSIVPFSASARGGDVSPTVIGDVDGDGKVTVNDATLVQYHLAELATINDAQKFVADVDDDGKVTVNDATMIQYYLAELIDGFKKQPAQAVTYVVAGTENLTGYNWNGSIDTGNVMQKSGDVYTLTFKNVDVLNEEMQVKVVAHEDGRESWYGDVYNQNVTFKLTKKCDVTVTFDPSTNVTSVSGDGVQLITGIEIKSMRVAGAADSGKGNWLNGVSWDPASDANLMTEVTDNVYRISYYDLPEEMGYEFKFAANGNWNANWGIDDTTEVKIGSPFKSAYNGGNIKFDLEEDSNVTITLDLSKFVYATKEGATITIDVEPTAPVIDAKYVVAGSANLTGYNWNGTPDTGHVMEKDGAVYTYTFKDVDVIGEEMQLKVVENIGMDQTWYGDANGQNVAFKVTKKTDVKVTFDPTTKVASVSGSGVQLITGIDINAMRIAGAADEGKGNWLNGISWDPAADANLMTKVSDSVYSITFKNLPEEMGYEFKLAANGSWNANWGIDEETEVTVGSPFKATYNGSNVKFDLDEESDVTITLDLTKFVYATKTGATIKIDATPSADNSVYVVAGTPNLTGYNWSGAPDTGNVLVQDGSVYKYTFKNVDTLNEEMQIKVVANKDGNQNWIGDENGQNIAFKVTKTSDVTVTFDPATQKITVSGSGVELIKGLEINNLYIVGAADEGKGNWLNGVSWEPGAPVNMVPMVSDKVYSITFRKLPEEMGYEFKFAANGDWNANWGIDEKTTEATPGTPFNAAYNGNNIKFDLEEESDVTITLDLRNFVYATKEGAKITIDIKPPTDYVYVVAGSENLTAYYWNGLPETGNIMTANDDGTYSYTFKNIMASSDEMQFKVVGNPTAGGDLVWYGPSGSTANYAFRCVSDCDITVTFDPNTLEMNATGTGVEPITSIDIKTITVAGSGEEGSAWINGYTWDTAAAVNHMTQISKDVYQITFNNIEENIGYEFKFAANDTWENNWGVLNGTIVEPGVYMDAVVNAGNIQIDVEDDNTKVVITLDLTKFDYTTKKGAKFKVDIIAP